MQEFLSDKNVNCNFMSLTGYRTLVLFDLILKKSSTVEDINNYFLQNKYIHGAFSKDMLRIYLNSLRAVGCTITRASKSNNYTYKILEHPFNLDITNTQLKVLKTVYGRIFSFLDFEDILAFDNFFIKLSKYLKVDEQKNKILQLCKLSNFNQDLLRELIKFSKLKNKILITYNSSTSGIKNVYFSIEKIGFNNEKPYIWGFNFEYNNFGYLRIDKIISIKLVNFDNKERFVKNKKIKFQIKNNFKYLLNPNEKILDENALYSTVECMYENKFELIQRILSLRENCKILEPQSLKNEIKEKLKLMRSNYNAE